MEAASPDASIASTSSTTTVMTSASETVDATGSTADGSAGPVVVQDTSVRVVESVKNHVVTNKTVVQRTSNTNATQVNKYDLQGNLKSSDIDTSTWEDRDTQSYQWSDKQQPPTDALAPPPTDSRVDQFFSTADHQQQQHGTGEDQTAVVLTTAERCDVPAVHWTGASANHQVDEKAGQEHHMSTKLEGSQWSRSGEAVWISSSTAVPVPASSSSKTPAIDPADASGVTPAAVELSVEERRKRRCLENRSRKAAAATSSAVRIRPSPTAQ